MDIASQLKRVALWKKFSLLGILCLSAIVLPTTLYWKEVEKDLAFAQKEQQGLPQSQLIMNLIQRTQQHRGLCARYLQDPDMPAREQRMKAEEVNKAIFAYEVYRHQNPNEAFTSDWSEIVSAWRSLDANVAAKKINYMQSFEQHTQLIGAQLRLLRTLVDYHKLSLDPDANGYFLIDASLAQLPELTEILGQIRGYGTGLLVKGEASFDERAQLKALMLMSVSKANELEVNIHKAAAARQAGHQNIYANYQSTQTQHQKAIDTAQREILDKQSFTLAPETYYSEFSLGVNSYFGYAHYAIEELTSILHERIDTLKRQMFSLLLYVFALTLAVAAVSILFVRRLLRQLGGEPYYANEIVQAVSQGDLDCEVETEYPESLLGNMKVMQRKLKENDRLKNEFVSTVSHELRTPLTAIGGALSLAVSGQLGAMSHSALKVLEIAQKNSGRLTNLINDLLDIDKLSIGKIELDLTVQPVMPIIDEACASMASYVHKYGVHIVVGPRFEYALVKVDARRLSQILVNFLSNAAKFSRQGEEIAINASVSAETVRIEVVDHGVGIPEEFQSKIFQRFSQADSSNTRAAGGTGLGLAIAKELIQRMNGTIGFSSTVGVGSCFYVELPLEEANSD